jgi:hypothetical protein
MKTLYILPFIYLCNHAALAAYRWVDAEGNVQYTQTPPPAGVNVDTIKTPTLSAEPAPVKKPSESGAKNPEKPAADKSDKNREIDEKNAVIRKANCAKAQEHMRALGTGAPMLMADPQNPEKFVVMSDELRQQKQTETQNHIADFCNDEQTDEKK